MDDMINVFLMGKKYSVPSQLTIMTAMEYAGYKLVRGCGCRNGFCGACATIYRIKGQRDLKVCLACQTKVEEGMYIATLPFFQRRQAYYTQRVQRKYAGRPKAYLLCLWRHDNKNQCTPASGAGEGKRL